MTDSKPWTHDGRACCAAHGEQATGAVVKDPVCGMTVDPERTPHHAVHAGSTYHFCSAGCRTKFVADPERSLSDGRSAWVEASPGSMWTCPMHPEIRQDHSGSCPICGMVDL